MDKTEQLIQGQDGGHGQPAKGHECRDGTTRDRAMVEVVKQLSAAQDKGVGTAGTGPEEEMWNSCDKTRMVEMEQLGTEPWLRL
jgi:hypothetical protein